MKMPKNIKATFLLNIVLLVIGLIVSNDVAVGSAAVIFVILASTVEILEAMHGSDS